MTIRVRLRTDTKEPAWQVDIKAMPAGALKAKRYRYTAPRSITSKSGALRWGEQMRRDIEAGKPPPQSKEGREEAPPVEVARPSPAAMTLRDAAAIYLEDCAGLGNASTTLTTKRSKLNNILAVAGDALLATAGEPEASKVRAALRAAGLTATTINAHVRLLQSVITRCHVLKYREAAGVRLEVVSERRIKVPKAYDDAAFEALVMQAEVCGTQHLGIVLVAGEAGLRVGELRGLEVHDFDAARGLLHVERSAGERGEIGPPKNGEARVVPLSARVIAVLGRLVEGRTGDVPIFLNPAGERMSRQAVRFRLNQALRLAGMPLKGIHTLRHTCATSALAGGADVVAVQRLLGHRNLQTTVSSYLHDTGEAPARALAAITSARAQTEALVTDRSRLPCSSRKPRGRRTKPK